MAQRFAAIERIVVGERHEIHAAALQQGVDLFGIAVRFQAEGFEDRHRRRSREPRMDVQVAFHVSFVQLKCYGAMKAALRYCKYITYYLYDTKTVLSSNVNIAATRGMLFLAAHDARSIRFLRRRGRSSQRGNRA